MNRTETIQAMAMSADISKAAAERVIDAFEARLKLHTDAGKRVVLRGFGSFSRGVPTPKAGRNPQTGQPLTYTAYHKPKNVPAVRGHRDAQAALPRFFCKLWRTPSRPAG